MNYPPYADGDGQVEPYGFEPWAPNQTDYPPFEDGPVAVNENLVPYGTEEGLNEDHTLGYNVGQVPAFAGDAARATTDAPRGRGDAGTGCASECAVIGEDGESPFRGDPVVRRDQATDAPQ